MSTVKDKVNEFIVLCAVVLCTQNKWGNDLSSHIVSVLNVVVMVSYVSQFKYLVSDGNSTVIWISICEILENILPAAGVHLSVDLARIIWWITLLNNCLFNKILHYYQLNNSVKFLIGWIATKNRRFSSLNYRWIGGT